VSIPTRTYGVLHATVDMDTHAVGPYRVDAVQAQDVPADTGLEETLIRRRLDLDEALEVMRRAARQRCLRLRALSCMPACATVVVTDMRGVEVARAQYSRYFEVDDPLTLETCPVCYPPRKERP